MLRYKSWKKYQIENSCSCYLYFKTFSNFIDWVY